MKILQVETHTNPFSYLHWTARSIKIHITRKYQSLKPLLPQLPLEIPNGERRWQKLWRFKQRGHMMK
jgi:hypothetical protein